LAAFLSCAAPRGEVAPSFDHLVIEEKGATEEGEANALYLLARFQESRGEMKEAIRSYGRLVRLDPSSVEGFERLAVLSYESRDLDRAIDAAWSAIELEPRRERSLTTLARSYMESDRTDEAIERFEKLAHQKSGSGSETVHYLLAALYQARGDEERMLQELERAVELAPDHAFYRYRLADRLRRGGEFERAEREYRKAIEHARDDGPIYLSLGALYLETGRREDAIDAFEEAADHGHRPMEVHGRLVSLYLSAGAVDDAVRHAEALKELDPMNLDLRIDLAELYFTARRPEDALRELSMHWKALPEDPRAPRRMVEYHLVADQLDDADRILRKMLADDIEDPWAWSRISYVHLRRGEEDLSREALERAHRLDPEDNEIHYLLGRTYLLQQRPADAYELFLRAYKQGYRKPELLLRLGDLENRFGDSDRAVEILRELIELEPENASALNFLGYLFAEQGRNLDEAEQLVGQALSLDPENPFFLDSLGWIYYRQGRYDEAVHELTRALSGLGEDPTVMEHLGDAYAAAGMRGKARGIYRTLIQREVAGIERIREKLRGLPKKGDPAGEEDK